MDVQLVTHTDHSTVDGHVHLLRWKFTDRITIFFGQSAPYASERCNLQFPWINRVTPVTIPPPSPVRHVSFITRLQISERMKSFTVICTPPRYFPINYQNYPMSNLYIVFDNFLRTHGSVETFKNLFCLAVPLFVLIWLI